ncbi:PREDICTED: CD83 antigen [Galeopterus variegatus]|uniref:CD83 antigen n=1 Tax=Galeopterus variegatus TaxID=482537 RepID=A0ABM0RKC7_GALVR|nr:PREDICTED: CD83 antigen [Galeopterus variegatus]
MSRGLQLLLLSCGRARERLWPPPPRETPFLSLAHGARSLSLAACSLAPATREVKVACSEDVDLPCTAPWDPRVPYTVSWTKHAFVFVCFALGCIWVKCLCVPRGTTIDLEAQGFPPKRGFDSRRGGSCVGSWVQLGKNFGKRRMLVAVNNS